MRYADEFRDPVLARTLVGEIQRLAAPLARERARPLQVMEVCGGHTHTIFRYGLKAMLPEESIEFVHGPGCPVCVLPMGRVDDCVALARDPRDHLRHLRRCDARTRFARQPAAGQGRGADVRMVYSPLDALQIWRAPIRSAKWCSSRSASRPRCRARR
jgi:hydrogenase expression/formation protein HypD